MCPDLCAPYNTQHRHGAWSGCETRMGPVFRVWINGEGLVSVKLLNIYGLYWSIVLLCVVQLYLFLARAKCGNVLQHLWRSCWSQVVFQISNFYANIRLIRGLDSSPEQRAVSRPAAGGGSQLKFLVAENVNEFVWRAAAVDSGPTGLRELLVSIEGH